MKKQFLPDKIFGIDSAMAVLWLEPMALAIILILSLVLVIVPKINEIPIKLAEIKSVTAKISDVDQKIKYLQTVDQEEIKKNASQLAAGLLPEKNSYMLVKVIRNAVAEASYSIDDFSISMGDVKGDVVATKNNSGYDKIPVSVSLVGPATNYIALVKSLEKSLPIISIDNFDMSTQTEIARIKLSVSAYYLREISDLKLESLTLADLTPSQGEIDLLSQISGYKTMLVESSGGGGTFVKYQRQDPFFTP